MLFMQSTPLFSTELGIVAVLAAILLLLLTDLQELQDVLHRVEWDTLIFFACLFVVIQVQLILHNKLLQVYSQIAAKLECTDCILRPIEMCFC